MQTGDQKVLGRPEAPQKGARSHQTQRWKRRGSLKKPLEFQNEPGWLTTMVFIGFPKVSVHPSHVPRSTCAPCEARCCGFRVFIFSMIINVLAYHGSAYPHAGGWPRATKLDQSLSAAVCVAVGCHCIVDLPKAGWGGTRRCGVEFRV